MQDHRADLAQFYARKFLSLNWQTTFSLSTLPMPLNMEVIQWFSEVEVIRAGSQTRSCPVLLEKVSIFELANSIQKANSQRKELDKSKEMFWFKEMARFAPERSIYKSNDVGEFTGKAKKSVADA